jgi:hypothetical protein
MQEQGIELWGKLRVIGRAISLRRSRDAAAGKEVMGRFSEKCMEKSNRKIAEKLCHFSPDFATIRRLFI